jgi:hypothetical protein
MSDEIVTRRYAPRCLQDTIPLPGGDSLIKREIFAKKTVGVSDRTVRRLNLPTVYVGSVAYVRQNESLQLIADKAKCKNQPAKRRRA